MFVPLSVRVIANWQIPIKLVPAAADFYRQKPVRYERAQKMDLGFFEKYFSM